MPSARRQWTSLRTNSERWLRDYIIIITIKSLNLSRYNLCVNYYPSLESCIILVELLLVDVTEDSKHVVTAKGKSFFGLFKINFCGFS